MNCFCLQHQWAFFKKNKKTKFKICRLRATERFSKHPVAEFIYKFYYWWLLAILTAKTLQISTVCRWKKKSKKCDFWHLQQQKEQHETCLHQEPLQKKQSVRFLVGYLEAFKTVQGQQHAWL